MSEGEAKVAGEATNDNSDREESSREIVSHVTPPTNLSISPQTSSANSWRQNYNKMNRAQRNTARKGLNNTNKNKNAKLEYLKKLNDKDTSTVSEPAAPISELPAASTPVSDPVITASTASTVSAVNASANGPKTYVCGCLKPTATLSSDQIIKGIQALGATSGTTLGGTRRKRNKHNKHNKSCKRNKSHKHSKRNKSCKKSKRSKRRKSRGKSYKK